MEPSDFFKFLKQNNLYNVYEIGKYFTENYSFQEAVSLIGKNTPIIKSALDIINFRPTAITINCDIPKEEATHEYLITFSPTILARRSLISRAALLVNVTAKILPATAPCCTIYAILEVKTFVFPLPAPAKISSAPFVVWAASSCSLLSPSKIFSIPYSQNLNFVLLLTSIQKRRAKHNTTKTEGELMIEILDSIEDNEQQQQSIMVPVDDMDTAEQSPDTVDELAMELATIKQPAKRIAIIGSRNLAITHQQMIETLTTALVQQGNTIITSGGSCGTNAAAIRGAMKSNPDKLKVILPQTIGQQPSDVQDQLIGVPNIVEHSDRAMMTLADASRVCNREIIDDCNQMICFLSHTSKTLHRAVEYAEENHKVITVFYLD